MQRAQLLRQLMLDSQYAVDEQLVAAAIVARAKARRLVPEASFRNDLRGRRVRSFRPSRQARSLRACLLTALGGGIPSTRPHRS